MIKGDILSLPKGWETKQLGEIYSFKNGINFDKTQKNGEGVLTLDVLNMYCEGLKVNVDNLYRINKQISDDYKLKNGDILIVRSSVKEAGVAWTTFFEEVDEPITYCGFIIRGRPIINANAKYIVYYLRSPEVRNELIKKSVKSTITNINQAILSSVIIPLPTLPEQQSIVATLDQAFEGIAMAKTNAEQNLKNAKELFESYLQGVFGSRHDGWEEKTVGEVCSFEGGSQPSKKYFEYNYREGLIRLIQIRDYKSEKHIVYIPIEMAKRFCDENEIMIGRYGPPVFQILRGLKGAYNVALMKAIPNEKFVEREFMFFYLQHRGIQQYIISLSERAVGQTGISREDLEAYPIYFPNKKVQSEITIKINALSAETKRLEAIYQQKLADLEEIKKSLLQKAFNGELKTIQP